MNAEAQALEDLLNIAREEVARLSRAVAMTKNRNELARCEECGCAAIQWDYGVLANSDGETVDSSCEERWCPSCCNNTSLLLAGDEDPGEGFEVEHDDENCSDELCSKIPGIAARRDARNIKEAR